MPSDPKGSQPVFPLLEVRFQANPMLPEGTGQLALRTSQGWAYYVVTGEILEDFAGRALRVAKTMPRVPTMLVRPPFLADS